ncbi:MAG: PH domain-containing protein [Acetivibrionales bacterium]
MIDFKNASFVKLRPVDRSGLVSLVEPMLIPDEQIVATFQGIRDGVIFTDKRIISINVQGITGKRKDFTTMPYSKIQVFSVETAGHFDLDAELDLWFSGLGRVRFEFTGRTDISQICKLISTYTLK